MCLWAVGGIKIGSLRRGGGARRMCRKDVIRSYREVFRETVRTWWGGMEVGGVRGGGGSMRVVTKERGG